MRANPVAAVLFSLSLSAVVACGSAPSAEEGTDGDSTASTNQALKRLGTDQDPVGSSDVEPPPRACPSLRYDLYRSGSACEMPAARAGGTWSMQPLFPGAPAAVRDRFCAYTWSPSGEGGRCAAAPTGAIPRESLEKLGARGHCPLSQPGCGTTTVRLGGLTSTDALPTVGAESAVMALAPTSGGSGTSGNTDTPSIGTIATFVTMASPKPASTLAGPSTTQKSAVAAPTAPGGSSGGASSSGGSSGGGPGSIPLGGVGCCDACAEVLDSSTWVVLPENFDYTSVYFDVGYQTPLGIEIERVTVANPATNAIQVNLNPFRQYSPGMIWAIHTTR